MSEEAISETLVSPESELNDSIEKPTTKEKKPYKMTEARKAAFERCRQARSAQIKDIRKKKIIDSGLAPPPETPKPEPEPEHEPVKQKEKRKAKKVIVYQSESSSESSSDSDIEVEVRRKPRHKSKSYSPPRQQRIPVDSPVNPYQQILTWL